APCSKPRTGSLPARPEPPPPSSPFTKRSAAACRWETQSDENWIDRSALCIRHSNDLNSLSPTLSGHFIAHFVDPFCALLSTLNSPITPVGAQILSRFWELLFNCLIAFGERGFPKVTLQEPSVGADGEAHDTAVVSR